MEERSTPSPSRSPQTMLFWAFVIAAMIGLIGLGGLVYVLEVGFKSTTSSDHVTGRFIALVVAYLVAAFIGYFSLRMLADRLFPKPPGST